MPKLTREQWTLGDLIDALEKRPADQSVVFGFGYFVPGAFGSYRGFYEDLAIEYISDHNTEVKVGPLLARAKEALERTFTGYKGGEYVMHRDSALWVSNYGKATSTIITGIAECDWRVVLQTKWIEA